MPSRSTFGSGAPSFPKYASGERLYAVGVANLHFSRGASQQGDFAGRLPQADLIAKKIGMVSGQMYATPAYLKSIGNPSKPTEFNQASFIGFEDNHQYLNFLKGCGFVDLTARNFPLTTDNRIVQWELVKQGLGIGVMQVSVGDAERAVTRALPHLDRAPGEMWLVAHGELRTSRRIRNVFDFLASELTY